MTTPPVKELIDLHIHVGAAVAPHILWSLAHEQGFKLPVSDYWEFVDAVTAGPDRVRSLDDYIKILHTLTERIQSSPMAVERSVYEIIGREYRRARVTQIELRFNPMRRNLGGERDLDHIIHAALRGMDRAMLEYGVRAGLIFCLAREYDAPTNAIIVEKAIRYLRRGVVGIDLAGSEKNALELHPAELKKYRALYERARASGLKTTVHTGETAETGPAGVIAVVQELKPERLGHGIRASTDPRAMELLAETGTVLEICPTSNLHTHAVENLDELSGHLRRFLGAGVQFTINTDGPCLLNTSMKREVALVQEQGMLSETEIDACLACARRASFLDVH